MKDKAIQKLRALTGHHEIHLMSRGNTAIFAALSYARKARGAKPVVIPDQGGWITYKKYPKRLGMDIRLCKTDLALIDTDDLKEQAKGASAFIYAQPGAYAVTEPMEQIYDICKKSNCLVIMDVTGSLGTGCFDGRYADLLVASFGEKKPVSLGYGGMATVQDNALFEDAKDVFDRDRFIVEHTSALSRCLDSLKERQKRLQELHQHVKQDLQHMDIIHEKSKGINVLVAFHSEQELQEIRSYCSLHDYPYKIVKRQKKSTDSLMSFIKVNADCVSVQVISAIPPATTA